MAGSTLTRALARLTKQLGALLEGDLFSVLKLSPLVCRSYEFALVDGCLDCTRNFSTLDSWAERLQDLESGQEARGLRRELLAFDVKSKITSDISAHYVTTVQQSRHTAFYIGICAADPSSVELIPNYCQGDVQSGRAVGPDSLNCSGDVAVDSSAAMSLPRSLCGGLALHNTPHQMPLAMLPDALRRVRAHFHGISTYENPWTRVAHPDWKPEATTSLGIFKAAEGSQLYKSHQLVSDIARSVNLSAGAAWSFDLVGLQPLLADAKFVNRSTMRQVLVEHKFDSSRAQLGDPLLRVPIARTHRRKDGATSIRWYCSGYRRFDYLLYQFTLPDEIFLLPERVIPDSFYTAASELQVSFERPEFQPYRVAIGQGPGWVHKMLQILDENPQPRRLEPRPDRRPQAAGDEHEGLDAEAAEQHATAARPFEQILTLRHRQFFWNIMVQCAERRSGLLLVLPSGHTMGDFAFCAYSWTAEEQRAFLDVGVPPQFLHTLPAHTPLLCMYVITRSLECDWHGPVLRTARFRRLDLSPEAKLILVDVFGSDEPRQGRPWAVIPSEDVHPTDAQDHVYRENLANTDRASFRIREPTMHALLKTGLTLADYNVGASGPSVYDNNDWSSIWCLLRRFSRTQCTLDHPQAVERASEVYHIPLHRVHHYTCLHGASPRDNLREESNAVHMDVGGSSVTAR